MIISEKVYANVSLFGLVRMNRCLPRQADCVLLRNSEWFRREDEATTRFSLLSDTVRIPSCTLVHTPVHSRVSTLFQCQSTWNALIVYRTQACILGSFFFAAIWREEIPMWLSLFSQLSQTLSRVTLVCCTQKMKMQAVCVAGGASQIPLHYECL